MFTVKGLIAGGRDVVPLHKGLGKIFRAFEYGTGLGRADDRNGLRAGIGFQLVIDAFYQRVFRAYHHHVDGLFDTEGLDGLEVVGLHGHVLTTVAGTCIAWSNVKLLTFLTLSYFPCEGVLTATAA